MWIQEFRAGGTLCCLVLGCHNSSENELESIVLPEGGGAAYVVSGCNSVENSS